MLWTSFFFFFVHFRIDERHQTSFIHRTGKQKYLAGRGVGMSAPPHIEQNR